MICIGSSSPSFSTQLNTNLNYKHTYASLVNACLLQGVMVQTEEWDKVNVCGNQQDGNRCGPETPNGK